MNARVIEVMAWQPEVPGTDRHVGRIDASRREVSWQDAGLCAQADPALFYPEQGESAAAARRVCRACPVREQCLAYALETGQEWGVWGGTTERERQRVRAARRRDELAA